MAVHQYYLGIDQGTTGTTALIIDEQWNVVSSGYQEHSQIYPQPGWVEHDPLEIWEAVKTAITAALHSKNIEPKRLRCIGIANQGETVMLWDRRTGAPVYNAIVWQDRRTAKFADTLKENYQDLIRTKTGLMIDAYFSATKIKWILDHEKGVRERAAAGEIVAGTLDSWLIWKLTGGRVHCTDFSTASRTMLLNIHTGQWDRELLELLDIPPNILPEITDSATVMGYTAAEAFFGVRVPIAGSAVDQQAALFGQACFQPGTIKTTYGTGCFMLMNTGERIAHSPSGLLTTVAWGLNRKLTFALDGGVYIAGAAIQWLRDGLKIIDRASETEALALSVPDCGGVYFVPAFVGLAAPHWDQYARGMMVGITGGTTRAHVVRATLESIAYQVNDNLEVMKVDSGMPIAVMRVDGGAVGNNFLMQFQADILGIPVDVPVITETTALGAVYLSALGLGDFGGMDEIAANWKLKRRFEPQMGVDERENRLYTWRRAVERSKAWIEE